MKNDNDTASDNIVWKTSYIEEWSWNKASVLLTIDRDDTTFMIYDTDLNSILHLPINLLGTHMLDMMVNDRLGHRLT